jgi:hypothetical protein
MILPSYTTDTHRGGLVTYELTEAWTVALPSLPPLTIPAGTRWAPSVPAWAHRLVPPASILWASLVHDYLHRHRGQPPGWPARVGLWRADSLMAYVMREVDATAWWRRRLVMAAVRAGSWAYWYDVDVLRRWLPE